MPIRNEAHFIERSLGAVLQQDYPADKLEIVIADGMSDDQTIRLIQRMPAASRLRIVPNTSKIQAAGLNRAIEAATGDIIVRVDGHTIIARDYVRRCVETLQTTKAQVVGGRLCPHGITPMGRAIAQAGSSRLAIPTAFRISQASGYVDTVYMGAWRRSTLEAIGMFDERLVANEDYELNYRIRQRGGKIYLSQLIASEYYCATTLGDLARRHFRYGYWKSVTLRLHPASTRWRQLAAPLFCLYLLAIATLFAFHLTQYWYMSVGILAYLILLATAALSNGGGDRWLAWRLPLVYFVLHLTWGAGFWWGLLHQRIPDSRQVRLDQ